MYAERYAAMYNHYTIWALARFGSRFVAYIILQPVLLVISPIMLLGDTFGRAFYRLKDL